MKKVLKFSTDYEDDDENLIEGAGAILVTHPDNVKPFGILYIHYVRPTPISSKLIPTIVGDPEVIYNAFDMNFECEYLASEWTDSLDEFLTTYNLEKACFDSKGYISFLTESGDQVVPEAEEWIEELQDYFEDFGNGTSWEYKRKDLVIS